MSVKARILLVEDDASLGFVVKDSLEEQGYEVLLCSDGDSGWNQFRRHNIDICLLDVMLPKIDGMTLATRIRQMNSKIPILFLTARNLDEDKIAGFRAGGDDYIVKPFNMEELMLRLEVFLKRTKDDNTKYEIINFSENSYFDYKNLLLVNQGKHVQLTQKESDLIKYLLQNANMLLKREDILINVWGKDDYFLGRSMDVFMTKIRKYIKGIEQLELQTVHGVGFKFVLRS
ncbi:MAG TPA: response regulator transcription factor [Edaphocola sp.]|nr:response regulator transcription factor [Edaphocola sp.]